MDKNKLKVASEFRCIKCGEFATVTKVSDGHYRYSIKCTKCGYGGVFTQKLFDYAKEHDGYLPLEFLGLNKSSIFTAGTVGNSK